MLSEYILRFENHLLSYQYHSCCYLDWFGCTYGVYLRSIKSFAYIKRWLARICYPALRLFFSRYLNNPFNDDHLISKNCRVSWNSFDWCQMSTRIIPARITFFGYGSEAQGGILMKKQRPKISRYCPLNWLKSKWCKKGF